MSLVVLVALALALAASSARAETSGDSVYKPALEGVESFSPEVGGKTAAPTKGGSKQNARSEAHRPPGPTTESEGSEHGTESGAAPGDGGDHRSGGGKSDGGAAAKATDGDHHLHAENVTRTDEGSAPTRSGDPAGHGGGGSSPVLPVLIAMAALAVISFGVVVYRGRTEGTRPKRV